MADTITLNPDKSYRLSRLSKEPAIELNVRLNIAGGGLIQAAPATDDGPAYSEVVTAEVASAFVNDEGLSEHFEVVEVGDPHAKPARQRAAKKARKK